MEVSRHCEEKKYDESRSQIEVRKQKRLELQKKFKKERQERRREKERMKMAEGKGRKHSRLQRKKKKEQDDKIATLMKKNEDWKMKWEKQEQNFKEWEEIRQLEPKQEMEIVLEEGEMVEKLIIEEASTR